MKRRFRAVPASYEDELEAAIGKAVEKIQLDIHRRANGHAPLVPDMMIHAERDGWVSVAIAEETAAVAAPERPPRSRSRRTA